MDEEETDLMELGGSIKLVGFSEIDRSELVIVKKLVGSYARRFSDRHKDFESLSVTMKVTHKREKSEKYELAGKLLLAGKVYASKEIDRNLFFALDTVLKKLETETSE